MGDFLDKLSTYNIFNFLLPGTLFAAVADRYSSYTIIQSDVLVGLFTYYFIGLVISRIGSLFLQPLLIKRNFLNFSDYGRYVSASKADTKLDVLSAENNMYRTLCSLFICLLIFMGFDALAALYPVLNAWAPYVVGLGLLVLFLFSWRKQADTITKRIIEAEQKSE